MPFEDWLTTKLPKPGRGPRGAALVRVLARRFDELVERAKTAAKLDLPSETLDEALPRVGEDRRIERAPGEGLDAYRMRLAGAWVSWSWAGTRYGIARAVSLLGIGEPQVLAVREAPPPGWDSKHWAVIRLVFAGRAAWGAARWGEFTWGGRMVQGVEALSEAEIRVRLRPVLRQWINARDRVLDITVGAGAPLWGRVTWGRFTWGSPGGPARRIGPARWGAARWGEFTWGAFL